MYQLMIVDDEVNILKSLKRVLGQRKNFELTTFDNTLEALRFAEAHNLDLIISDYRMPDMDGVQFLTKVKEMQPEAMRIILSGYADLQGLLAAINEANIFRFITKPWDEQVLIGSILQALEMRDVMVENRCLADQVRRQELELSKQKIILEQIEEMSPDYGNVSWTEGEDSILTDKGKN